LSKTTQAPAKNFLAEKILAAVRAVLPDPRRTYALHEPEFSGKEKEFLNRCVETTMVSSVGPHVERFARALEQYTGAKHAVAVVNGTAAIHIALKLAGVQPGDEVLVPSLTFAATANAVAYCGAVPHFVDSEETTLGVDAGRLMEHLQAHTENRNGRCIHRKTQKVIRALLPVHTFGHPVNLDGMLKIAHDFNLVLVEDAAESLGSLYQGHHTGTFGLLGTLSFNGNKIVTTGGGGAILTHQDELARKARHLTTTAKIPHPWEYRHDEIGYNYRMPNLNAALGCAQVEKIESFLERKRKLFLLYREALADLEDVRLLEEPGGCRSNYWLQTVLLPSAQEEVLSGVLQTLRGAGILARPAWNPLHFSPQFAACPRMDLQVAESLARRILNLPSSPGLAGDTP
jgi:aminotransferase in exopolysaccharide biosynthesis